MTKRLSIVALLAFVSVAQAADVYSNLPNPLPSSYFALRYDTTSTFEFGNRILLGGTDRTLSSLTVGLSSQALKSSPDNANVGTATTFDHPLTINVYAAGTGDLAGARLASKTQNFTIPYRALGSTGGAAFLATFDLASLLVTLPDEIVVGLDFNTQHNGSGAVGAGPWNSLGFGLVSTEAAIGSDSDDDDVMWNTSKASMYADGGAGGVGVFRRDTSWSGYAPAMSVQAVPEPASFAALGLGGLAMIRRRRR